MRIRPLSKPPPDVSGRDQGGEIRRQLFAGGEVGRQTGLLAAVAR